MSNYLTSCNIKSLGENVFSLLDDDWMLITAETEIGNIFFEQANLVFECRKMYSDEIKSNNFFDRILEKKIYKAKDYHHFFIGEIINCMKR